MNLLVAFLGAGGSMLAKDVFSTAYLRLWNRGRKHLAGLADGLGDALLSVSILTATHGWPRVMAALGMIAGSYVGNLLGDLLAAKVDEVTRTVTTP